MSEPAAPFHAAGPFADLLAEDIEGVLAVGTPESFPAGEPIFSEGDRGDAMYVITAGEARVEAGGRFHILKAGNFFGEMALLAPGPRMATVKAETDVDALTIPADAFQDFLMNHPAVGISMMKQLVLRLREVEQRIDAWMA